MAITAYRVKDGDTMPLIALQMTGDANRWTEIVGFNRLRAPYISNDIRDRSGSAISTGTLLEAVANGQTSFRLTPAPNNALVTVSGTILFGYDGPNGTYLYDLLTITDYDFISGVIAVDTGPQRVYLPGTQWNIYPYEQTTRVVGTNDLLYIPFGNVSNVRALDKFYDLFGTDIAINENGDLAWASQAYASGTVSVGVTAAISGTVTIPIGTAFQYAANGHVCRTTTTATIASSPTTVILPVQAADPGGLGEIPAAATLRLLATSTTAPVVTALHTATISAATAIHATFRPAELQTATGYANVEQAVVGRLKTQRGELPFHPEYGSRAWEMLGTPNRATEQLLIQAYVSDAVRQDDRVAQIVNSTISVDTDAYSISLAIQPRGTSERFTIDTFRLRFAGESP